MRVMSLDAALATLQLAKEVHEGKRYLPPEILSIQSKIKRAEARAYLFMIRLNAVDEGMIYEVVALMHERDRLYEEWIESEVGSSSEEPVEYVLSTR